MRAKPEYRNRDGTEVAVLDALADRANEGMTVFELRTRVDEDIDTLEAALGALKDDDLIDVDESGERAVIQPDEAVVGQPSPDQSGGFVATIRDRLPF